MKKTAGANPENVNAGQKTVLPKKNKRQKILVYAHSAKATINPLQSSMRNSLILY